MQNTSGITNYSTLISGSYTVETKVNINGVDYGENVLISVETCGSLFKENIPTIGCCISGEIDIEMLKPSATIPRMATIKPYIRLSNIAGTVKSGWLQKGEYFIDTRSTTKNNDGLDILKIHGYDAMLKAEGTYPDDNETYPKTDTYVLNLISTTLGIPVDSRTTAIMTDSYSIIHPAFATMREVLSNIAGMYAGNFCISPEGKLLLVQLGSIGDGTGTPNHQIGANARQLSISPAFSGFSKVIIRTGEYDSSGNEIIYESGNTTGRTLECENDWGSQTMADNILDILSGWAYQPYEAEEVVINPALELGDSISINGVYSGIYSNTLYFSRLFKADTKAPYDEEIDHEYAYEDPKERKYVRRTEELKADMTILAGTITAKVDKVNTNQTFGWTVTDSQWNVFNQNGPILTVNANGAYVKGEIQADTGEVGGFNIGSNAIYHTISSYGSTASSTGVYLGTDGVQLGQKFKVDTTGNVTASGMTITGGSMQIGEDDQGNPMFQVTSGGIVTAKSLSIQGGTISIGNAFRVDAQGNLNASSGTFSGNVYAGNIRYEATTSGAGTVSGQALTLGSVTAGLSGSLPTGQLSLGATLSLGYADLFNMATQSGTQTYPDYFTAGSVYGLSSVASRTFSVENSSGEELYHLNDHYHAFTESDGKIVIGIPHNRTAIADRSFNIADTQTYRDGVAAVTVASRAVLYCNATNYTDFDTGYDCDMTGSSYHYSSGGVTYGRIEIRNNTGTKIKDIRVKMPESSSSVTITGASGLASDSSNYTTYDNAASFASSSIYTSGSTQYARVQVTLSNGSTAIIRAGIPDPSGSVSVTGATGLTTTSSDYTTYDKTVSFAASSIYDSGSTLYARAQVTLSNGTTSIIRAGIPDTSGSVTVSGATGLTTSSSNYTTYDQTVSFASSSLYTSGSTQYARAQITLSNGNTAIIRAGMPAGGTVTSLTVTRTAGDSTDWVFDGSNIALKVTAKAYNGSTVLLTSQGTIDATDVMNTAYQLGVSDAGIDHASALTTTASNYGQYDSGYNFGLSGKLYTSGNYQYGRIGIYNSDSTLLKTIRVVIPGGGTVDSVVRANYSSSEYYSASLPYYKWTNNTGYVRAAAMSGSTVVTYGDLDVTTLVQTAMSMGGTSGHVEVTQAIDGSAFIKIYDNSWNAVPINGSSAGRWINTGTSYTFGS